MTTLALRAAPARGGAMAPALTPLSPSQAAAFEKALSVVAGHPILLVRGDAGVGKTTILQHLHARLGGRFLNCGDSLDAISVRHPHAVEEAMRGMFDEALRRDDVLFLDDLDAIETTTKMSAAYPRPYLFNAVLADLFARVRAEGKIVVISATSASLFAVTEAQAVIVEAPLPAAEDYAAIIAGHLGATNMGDLNTDHLFRNAGRLTAYQLQAACQILKANGAPTPTTEQFSACLSEHLLTSNLDVGEVEDVKFSDLKGAEGIVEKLERTILLPLKEPELAKSLGLKPKRGVLLHGDPGTGKTTIGRALARQMSGKFFMIDGTFIGGTGSFYKRVNALFEAAIANSPSIIFIDDADVLFKSDNGGFNRYLLTKLDGLASESVGHVCVMMTAMDIADMPVAMLRSGRVEVWLETKLPDADTRIEIVRHYAGGLPPEYLAFDDLALAAKTEGFTPADLRRLVGDARGYIAYDQFKGRPVQGFEHYLHLGAEEISELKRLIAAATQRKR
jgi:SpoVK/Ycf46/Vps4 family AAA+-type ATPase